MPSGQTSYVTSIAVAFAGLIDSMFNPTEVTSKTVASGVSTGIPEGVVVVRSGADDTSALPAASTDITGAPFQGIAARITAKQPNSGTAVTDGGTVMYMAKDQFPCLRAGVIWVSSEVAVSYNDNAFARYSANGGLTQLGALRNDADTSHAAQIPNAKFIDTIAAAGLARVRIGA